jgi:ribonuclease VapC
VIIDTSAVIAIITSEPGCQELVDKIGAATIRLMSAPSFGETLLVLRGRVKGDVEPLLRSEVQMLGIEIVEFRAEHLAWFAYGANRYGKGRHPAALNFGDCFSYALAKYTDLPLLFVGNDFSQTDAKQA